MERKEAIRSAYRLTGSSSFYDGMMTCSTLPGRLVCRLDYDFSLADKDAAMHSGVIARTIVLDRLVGEYLAAHPSARHHRGPDHMYLTQAAAMNVAFDARLQALRADNAAAGKEKQFHLEKQILPGIAAYETLQTVMPKEEALQTVHGYVEQRAWKLRKLFLALMHVPGLPPENAGDLHEADPADVR